MRQNLFVVSLIVLFLLISGLLTGCDNKEMAPEELPAEALSEPDENKDEAPARSKFIDQPPEPDDLKVAVFVGYGSAADKIMATMRALQAMGFYFSGIDRSDIKQGRLTKDHYDLLLIPAGGENNRFAYATRDGLDEPKTKKNIQDFVSAGGGVLAIEGGAYYISQNGGNTELYPGEYTREGLPGKNTVTITNPDFGSGEQEVYRSAGGGWFSTPPGTTAVASFEGNTVIACSNYGAGRVVVSSVDLELRGDSELDWTIWDNWEMDGLHENSEGAWKLLGRLLNWAAGGVADEPQLRELLNPKGARVAILTTYTKDGGSWPGLLPAVFRSVQYSGHLPLSIRPQEIANNKLTLENFKVIVFPGGYSYGYKGELAGHEKKLKGFIEAGGGVLGICAGSFYLSKTIVWEKEQYDYLDIFCGTDTGPLNDIVRWPGYDLTTTYIDDPIIGIVGTEQSQIYFGGGYKTDLGASDAELVATYSYEGRQAGSANAIRFKYGEGHVLLIGTHPELRPGSNEDWLAWDNYKDNTDTPLVNPDNPWTFVEAIFNNWLLK